MYISRRPDETLTSVYFSSKAADLFGMLYFCHMWKMGW